MMWILGIETTGVAGSVALLRAATCGSLTTESGGETLLCEDLPADCRSAQTLAPAIRGLLAKADCRPSDVRLVAMCAGPGSFTGLRVGVGTAKAFAYAVGAQVVGLDTLDVLAQQAPLHAGETVWCLLSAQRGELYAARYLGGQHGIECVEPCRIVAAEQWLAGLIAGEQVMGPALEKLAGKLPTGVKLAPVKCWPPHATTVARLGCVTWQAQPAGVSFSPFDLLPKYVRRVAAEEQWDKRRK